MKKMNIKGLLLLSSAVMLITGCTEKSLNVVKTIDSNKTHYHSNTKYSYYYNGATCCDNILNVSQKKTKKQVTQKDTKNVNVNIHIQPVESSITNRCESNTFDVDGDEIDHY